MCRVLSAGKELPATQHTSGRAVSVDDAASWTSNTGESVVVGRGEDVRSGRRQWGMERSRSRTRPPRPCTSAATTPRSSMGRPVAHVSSSISLPSLEDRSRCVGGRVEGVFFCRHGEVEVVVA